MIAIDVRATPEVEALQEFIVDDCLFSVEALQLLMTEINQLVNDRFSDYQLFAGKLIYFSKLVNSNFANLRNLLKLSGMTSTELMAAEDLVEAVELTTSLLNKELTPICRREVYEELVVTEGNFVALATLVDQQTETLAIQVAEFKHELMNYSLEIASVK